jgi:hypothetical protein
VKYQQRKREVSYFLRNAHSGMLCHCNRDEARHAGSKVGAVAEQRTRWRSLLVCGDNEMPRPNEQQVQIPLAV